MRTEAHALKADGIVGVHPAIQQHAWGAGELSSWPRAPRSRPRTPIPRSGWSTGALSLLICRGQDFFTLVKAGHFPRALVFGTCVYHVAHQSVRQTMMMTGQSMAIPLFTEAVYTARELAMTRMEDEAAHHGADGIVSVRGRRVQPHLGEHATEFLAIGTGVTTSPESGLAEPSMTLSLND